MAKQLGVRMLNQSFIFSEIVYMGHGIVVFELKTDTDTIVR